MALSPVITFSGLDGSGKSTLIEAFRVALESEGFNVRVLTMYDDLSFYSFLRRCRDFVKVRIGGHANHQLETKINPNFDLHKNSLFYNVFRSKALKAFVLPIDTLSIYLYLFFGVSRKEIVLLDRTSYDYIIDVLPERYMRQHLFIALIFSFRPSLPVFVDTPAQVSFDRKGEFSVSYLRWRSSAYKAIFLRLKRNLVLDNCNNSVEHNVCILLNEFRGKKIKNENL